MKTKNTVNTVSLIVVALALTLLTGCAIGYPSSWTSGYSSQFAKELQNNLADGFAVQIADGSGFEARIQSGQSVTYKTSYPSYPYYDSYSSYSSYSTYSTYSYYRGRRVCLIGKVYNPKGEYVGVTQHEIYLSAYNDNDCQPWIISGYEPKAQPQSP